MKTQHHNTFTLNTLPTFCASTLLGALFIAGCGSSPAETASNAPTTTSQNPPAPAATSSTSAPATRVATGKPKGSVKIGDKIVCVVCAVKEGSREAEPVKATLDYKGKSYGFCSTEEKAEFISAPTKYADAS